MCSLWDTLRARPDFSTFPQRNSVMFGTRRCERGPYTFALFGSLLGLIHLAVGLPTRIKGCYVRPLQELRTYFCAPCDLRVGLIFARHLFTRSSEQLVRHSAHNLRQNPRRLVRTSTSALTEPDAVALRQNAPVWTLPDMNKYTTKRVCLSIRLSGESLNKSS